MGHLYHGELLNNQRVFQWYSNIVPLFTIINPLLIHMGKIGIILSLIVNNDEHIWFGSKSHLLLLTYAQIVNPMKWYSPNYPNYPNYPLYLNDSNEG